MKQIAFDQIDTKLPPKKYFKVLQSENIFDRYEKVLPGELVKFQLPENEEFTLTYLGEKPEKFEEVDGVLTVEMTECLLVFISKVWDSDFSCDVAKMEVINAL